MTARRPRRPAPAAPRSRAPLTRAEAIGRCAAALQRRAALLGLADTNVGRLINGAADGLDGYVVERLGDVLIAQIHQGQTRASEDVLQAVAAHLAGQLTARAVYRKTYPRERSRHAAGLEGRHREAVPWVGTAVEPELAVREHGLTFLVRPYDGYLTGLFLDHRHERQLVRRIAAGKRVLNAFAYTGGFSVAASRGGAALTVSVDSSSKVLAWTRRNLAANDCESVAHRFICDDVRAYLRRARRQGLVFEVIVLDPPTFARTKNFSRPLCIPADLPELLEGALALLAPGGHMLLSVNHRATTRRHLAALIQRAALRAGRAATDLQEPPLPEDFAGDPELGKSILARLG